EEHFAVTGLTERFDETMLLLRKAFGWRMPLYGKSNVTKNRLSVEQIPKETFDLIAREKQLDIELYKFGQAGFDRAIGQMGRAFQSELANFMRLNRFYKFYFNLETQGRRLRRAVRSRNRAKPLRNDHIIFLHIPKA